MQRPFQKQVWIWGISVLIPAAIISSLPPVRIQYHKWRLEAVKARKASLLAAKPAAIDKLWLNLGIPVSGQKLDRDIRKHEDALVRLGFLKRASLPAQMVTACPETLESLEHLKSECQWYHAEIRAGTNFSITACPKMMDHWRQHAKELGW